MHCEMTDVKFQSTLPQGERRSWQKSQFKQLSGFQSTLPQGERPGFCQYLRHSGDFNPRSHKGSDILRPSPRGIKKDFNPRSHKGSDEDTARLYLTGVNFNPRSHKGSDRQEYDDLRGKYISIHAPTRGATMDRPQSLSFCAISIHAPTRGATTMLTRKRFFLSYFNPRSHKGSDNQILSSAALPKNFNPRSHKGSDSNFTQNSISVLFHFYQSFPHIIFPHTARFRLLIIFCTFFLVRIAQRFPVCFHFAPKQYPAFYNVCSTDLL